MLHVTALCMLNSLIKKICKFKARASRHEHNYNSNNYYSPNFTNGDIFCLN